MIYFIGDTPSRLNTAPNVAFKGAKCERRFESWLFRVLPPNQQFRVMNRTDEWFNDFHRYYEWIIRLDLKHTNKFVALGNNASKALGGIPHFKLPHPSGRNRQINDAQFILDKLEECRQYLNQ